MGDSSSGYCIYADGKKMMSGLRHLEDAVSYLEWLTIMAGQETEMGSKP
ncbi:MAG: hypothetical protein HQL57_10810 [Magnetococcales bacterium]|nr:hypothetical protein [Magnetococcales bacterium]